MITAPRSVVVVDDDPAVRRLLREGIPMHLEDASVATAVHGGDAIQHLCKHPVDVIVTDVSMPIMDGFTLLAYVRKHHPNLPVVVLSTMAAEAVMERAPQLGLLRILRKPASPAQVAEALRDAHAESASGRMTGVPLAALLHLIEIERKSCSLLVRSGERKGRLHFLSGQLVNAYSFELGAEGEAAARQVLGWHTVTVDFERSLHNHQRLIHTPMQTLLLEIATERDEREHRAARDEPGSYVAEHSMAAEPEEHAPMHVADGEQPTQSTVRSEPTGRAEPTEPAEPTERTEPLTEPIDPPTEPPIEASTAAIAPSDAAPVARSVPPDRPAGTLPAPASLADAAATLHQRLTELRARCETTGATVVALQPELEHVQEALAADDLGASEPYVQPAAEASLRELAAMAARLAQVAETLAAGSGDAPQRTTPD